MFMTTNAEGLPATVTVSFWQCVKAGVGFSVGAGVVTLAGVFLWALVIAPIYLRLIFRGLR